MRMRKTQSGSLGRRLALERLERRELLAVLAVPSGYSTISAAITAASAGDTINVAPGTYPERLVIDKCLNIQATGSASNTTINGQSGGSTVIISGASAANSTLSGFTITGGDAGSLPGGGVRIGQAPGVEISNCYIVGNRARVGGGISIFDSNSVLIQGNVIGTQNQPNVVYGESLQDDHPDGGGIFLIRSTSVSIVNNTISYNVGGVAGGGVAFLDQASGSVSGNTIDHNTATTGGGIYCEVNYTGTAVVGPTISNNTIANNKASYNADLVPGTEDGIGGGISAFGQTRITITDNCIQGNESQANAGGILIAEGSTATISRNTVCGNIADYDSNETGFAGGIEVTGSGSYSSSATIENNVVRDNSAYNGGGIIVGPGITSATVVNNTIVQNSVRMSSPTGAGLWVSVRDLTHTCNVAVRNNIIAYNSADDASDIVGQVLDGTYDGRSVGLNGSTVVYQDNLIQTTTGDNTDAAYLYWSGSPQYLTASQLNTLADPNGAYPNSGNIGGSPAFVDASSDNFRLQSTSPCIDTGTTTGAPTTDVLCDARGDYPDIGAYEYYPSATTGLYNPSTSYFYLRDSNTSGSATTTFGYGAANWKPIVGDWDGDGVDTKGLYDPTTSYFYLSNSVSGAYADITIGFGVAGWVPIAGDWDGDGIDTIGLYDATNSVFYLRNSNTTGGANYQVTFGQANWTPVIGDWNGDGKDTIGLYNPSTSYFYLCNSNTVASADYVLGFGVAGWRPIAGDWNSDGFAGIGLYDTAGTFYLRNTLSSGSADVTFTFTGGGSTWLPIAGHWAGTNLLADSVIADASGVAALTDSALTPLLQEALTEWAAAGIQADVLKKLASVNVQITDLPGAQLGTVCGDAIYIDATAAGHGWFVDTTPEANEEFLYEDGQSRAIESDAIDHMDLLTVLEHELGHVVGLDDWAADAHSLMSGVLCSGLRRDLTAAEVDAVFAEA